MNLLAIDTAASFLSVAVAVRNNIWYTETEAGTNHCGLVMGMMDAQMKNAGIKPNELKGILCMGGPGSFTGLRIGFSVAKGLALALGIPFAPIPTLDCMALFTKPALPAMHALLIKPALPCLIMPVIVARKKAFFCGLYSGGKRLGPDMDASAGQIAQLIENHNHSKNEKIFLTGPGAGLLFNSLPEELKAGIDLANENRGYARELIAIAMKDKIFDNDNTARLYEGPEYVRKSDAELNREELEGSREKSSFVAVSSGK